jgi:hypothetical protein
MSTASRRLWIQVSGSFLLAGVFLAANLANLHYGRADNGDMARLAGHWLRGPVGYELWPDRNHPNWERRFFACWHRHWDLRATPAEIAKAPPRAPDVGTTRFLWFVAFTLDGALDRVLGSEPAFDLLVLGWIVRATLLAALLGFYWTAAAHFRGRYGRLLPLLLTLPLALALADPRYTTFFHSFYREAGTLLYALLTVAALLAFSLSRFWGPLLGAAAAGMLLAGSASAHFFTCLLTAGALLAATLYRQRMDRSRPSRAAWAAAGMAVAGLLLVGMDAERQTERQLRKNAAYHTLFLGALRVSDDPAGHLAALGLPPTALARIETDAFRTDSQQFIQEHWDRIGHRAAARVLLREPVLIPRMLRWGASKLHDPFLGLVLIVRENCEYRPLGFAGWTRLKDRLLPGGYPLLAGLAGAALVGLAALFHSDRRVFGVGLALAYASLGALGETAVSVFGDGFADLGRHLVAASLFVDLVLVLLLWRLALALERARGGATPPVEPAPLRF